MMSAKLFVPAGGLDQANGGETFSPTQFALPAVLLECFFGIGVPSLKAGGGQHEGFCGIGDLTDMPRCQEHPAGQQQISQKFSSASAF
jgi:hypothetical protein